MFTMLTVVLCRANQVNSEWTSLSLKAICSMYLSGRMNYPALYFSESTAAFLQLRLGVSDCRGQEVSSSPRFLDAGNNNYRNSNGEL